jgi:hypothetical protein
MSQAFISRKLSTERSRDRRQVWFGLLARGRRFRALCDRGRSSNPISNIIDERVKKDIGTVEDIKARFDSVQVAMMTVSTLEDAEKLLKSVSEI